MRISLKISSIILFCAVYSQPLFAHTQESKNLSKLDEFVLRTPRTEIRVIKESDIKTLLEFMAKPGYQEMNGLSVGEMNRIYLEDDLLNIKSSSEGIIGITPPYSNVVFHFGVWFKGRLVGRIGFKDISNVFYAKLQGILPKNAAAVAIDYGFHADFRGLGLARESVSRLLQFVFEDLGYEKALAVILDRNETSRALASAMGFRSVHRVNTTYGRSTEFKVFFYYQLDRNDFHPCEHAAGRVNGFGLNAHTKQY